MPGAIPAGTVGVPSFPAMPQMLLKKTPLIAGDLGMLSHGGKFDLVLHFLISKSLIWHWRVSLGRTPPHPSAHAPAGAGGGAAAACAASLAKRNKL